MAKNKPSTPRDDVQACIDAVAKMAISAKGLEREASAPKDRRILKRVSSTARDFRKALEDLRDALPKA